MVTGEFMWWSIAASWYVIAKSGFQFVIVLVLRTSSSLIEKKTEDEDEGRLRGRVAAVHVVPVKLIFF